QLARSPPAFVREDSKPQSDLGKLASMALDGAISVAQITAELGNIPYLGQAVKCLNGILNAIQQSKVNRQQWEMLRNRCVMVLYVGGEQVRINGKQEGDKLQLAAQMIEATFTDIATRVGYYNEMNWVLAIFLQETISEEIDEFSTRLESCLSFFSFSSHVNQNQWIQDFRAQKQSDIRGMEQLHEELAKEGIVMGEVANRTDQIMKILEKVLNDKSPTLLPGDTTSKDKYVEPERIIYTILSVTNLHLPPELLAGGEQVAKKVFKLGTSKKAQLQPYASKLVRDANLWYGLQSKYILRFKGIGMEPITKDGHFQLYMVSPWMPNSDAMTYLAPYRDASGMKKGILRIESLVIDAAMGLKYLHESNIVHSGMCGSNVLISDSGGGVLGGLGLAKVGLKNSVDPKKPVVMTGKPASYRWQAPELIKVDDAVLTTHSDIWGWAMATLEIVSGREPFCKLRGEGPVIGGICEGQTPQKADYPEFIRYAYQPVEMWDLLEECWSQKPADRPTIDKVVKRLHEIESMPEVVVEGEGKLVA
ncbi:unnamed protein product, partial [Rhizoctonia solani]